MQRTPIVESCIIERLKTISKIPFLNVLAALNLTDLVLLSFDPFSTNHIDTENEHYKKFLNIKRFFWFTPIFRISKGREYFHSTTL